MLQQAHADRDRASALRIEILRIEIDRLTELARTACDGLACVVEWQSASSSGTSTALVPSLSDSALGVVRSLAERHLRRAWNVAQSLHIRTGAIAAHLNGKATTPIEAVAQTNSEDDLRIISLAIAPLGRSLDQMRGAVQLANQAARAILHKQPAEESIAFWRARSSDGADRLRKVTQQRDDSAAEQELLESTVAACSKLPENKRYIGLGAALATAGGFDAWIVAIGSPEVMSIVASSHTLKLASKLDSMGVIADAQTVCRSLAAHRETGMRRAAEDSIFAQYAAYLCVPFDGGAIAAAAHEAIARRHQ